MLKLLFPALLCFAVLPAQAQVYYVYVAAESQDVVDLVRFDSATRTAEVAKRIEVGAWPTEIEGPHGLAVDPSGDYWYVSLAHGQPFGKIVKYRTGTDEKVGEVEVGLFPATMQLSPATGLLYVVNFNLHGKHEPSSVSIVEPVTMTEVTRTPTGVMPHGSRLSPDGRRQYSVAMMDGLLYEMDAETFEVTRTLHTGTGAPRVMDVQVAYDSTGAHAGHGAGAHAGMEMGRAAPKPTWVHPHPTAPYVYVANNGTDEIVEVDLEAWTITRRFQTQGAPYNLEVTPDGQYLVASQKKGGTTGVFALKTGEEVVRLPNTRGVTHGVAIAPDGRFAFVSVEGVGGEPGAVDVIDLRTVEKVATVDVGKQAGGIAFWKIDAQ
ncbi:MAG: YncE family protein [Rhodothermales bacterium]|nr:YncE family protein [Rhodothermales bacterium]